MFLATNVSYVTPLVTFPTYCLLLQTIALPGKLILEAYGGKKEIAFASCGTDPLSLSPLGSRTPPPPAMASSSPSSVGILLLLASALTFLAYEGEAVQVPGKMFVYTKYVWVEKCQSNVEKTLITTVKFGLTWRSRPWIPSSRS